MSKSFQAFRITVALQALAILGQAITAGLLLSSSSGRPIHGAVAGLAMLAALAQVVASIVQWRPGGGPGRFVTQSVVMLLIVIAQAAFGVAHLKWAHVPLGVLMWGGILMLVTQIWSRPRVEVPAPA